MIKWTILVTNGQRILKEWCYLVDSCTIDIHATG
jgi:hypothetical protein